jgi:hypothetical protein
MTGEVEIIWSSWDDDGDPLFITIELLDGRGDLLAILFEGPMPSETRLAFNTSNYGNGNYGLRITVTDGYDNATEAVSSLEIYNPPINEDDDIDDDDDDTVPIDDDDEPPPVEEDDDGGGGYNVQMVIAIIIIGIALALIAFAVVKKVNERLSEKDPWLLEE